MPTKHSVTLRGAAALLLPHFLALVRPTNQHRPRTASPWPVASRPAGTRALHGSTRPAPRQRCGTAGCTHSAATGWRAAPAGRRLHATGRGGWHTVNRCMETLRVPCDGTTTCRRQQAAAAGSTLTQVAEAHEPVGRLVAQPHVPHLQAADTANLLETCPAGHCAARQAPSGRLLALLQLDLPCRPQPPALAL